jgi:hypothetical protein
MNKNMQVGKSDTQSHGLRGTAVLVFAAMLASCASKKETKTDYASMRFEQRLDKQMDMLKGKDTGSIKNPFQNEVYNASRSVKTSEFKTGASTYRPKKGFFGSKDKFKAGTFSQADKTSNAGNRIFSGADDKSRVGGGIFKTKQNRFNGQMSSSANKTSPMADDVFSTAGNKAALKNTSSGAFPVIDRTPSYSEDEVRSLLKKD